MDKYTYAEKLALETVLCDCIHNKEFLDNYQEHEDILSINTCRNGRKVAWCIWSEGNESARYIDTGEQLSQEEIEEQLL